MSKKKISELEFISLMASLMAMSALSIDAILPGLAQIGQSLNILDAKDNQLLITTIFLGLGIGQLVSGTISDSIGRKPVVYIGSAIFALASFICVLSTNLEMMIVGRLLQGIGLSAYRSVSMSIIRDQYSGDYMARIMSFVTVIFILVPIIAPSYGKLILDVFGWESIFYSQLIFGFVVVLWFARRQVETLQEENRKKLSITLFIDGTKEFFKHKDAVLYTLAIGIISAPFLAYISASQQIFQEQYLLVDEYAYIFSGLAISIGLATYFNGLFVVKIGMFRMASLALAFMLLVSLMYILLFNGNSNPSVVFFIIALGLILFSTGFIVGNISALAMQPIGHIAGIGAAIVGFISTVLTVPLATFIGRFINDTATPIFIGFAVCGTIALCMILYIKAPPKKQFTKAKRRLVYNILNK